MIKIDKKTNKKFFLIGKIITFFLVIYLFSKFINKNDFFIILEKIKFTDLIPIFLLFLLQPFLITLRWYVLIKNFSKISLLNFFKNIVEGFSFSLALSSSLALEAAKFFKIKKELGNKKSIILIILDKFLALYFKLIFILLSFTFYLNLYEDFKIDYYLMVILIIFSLVLIFLNLPFFTIFILKKINSKLNLKVFKKIFSVIKEKVYQLILANLVVQLANCSLYFLIFIALNESIDLINLFILVPVIELLSQFQFLVFGMKELSTVFMFSFFSVKTELALVAAIIYTFFDYLTILILYLILSLIRKK